MSVPVRYGARLGVTCLMLVFSPTIRNAWPKPGTPSSEAAPAGRGTSALISRHAHDATTMADARWSGSQRCMSIMRLPSSAWSGLRPGRERRISLWAGVLGLRWDVAVVDGPAGAWDSNPRPSGYESSNG